MAGQLRTRVASPAGAVRGGAATVAGVVGAVAARPSLWPVALRQARRLAPTGWWRRPPFLPLPPGPYRRFRLQTMYGTSDHAAEPSDVVQWLEWCRAQ